MSTALPARRPDLGRYNATRAQWAADYRAARIDQREGRKPNPKHKGTRWKAALIVAYDRDAADALDLATRAAVKSIVDYILSEPEAMT